MDVIYLAVLRSTLLFEADFCDMLLLIMHASSCRRASSCPSLPQDVCNSSNAPCAVACARSVSPCKWSRGSISFSFANEAFGGFPHMTFEVDRGGVPKKQTKGTKSVYLWQWQGVCVCVFVSRNTKFLRTSYMEGPLLKVSLCDPCWLRSSRNSSSLAFAKIDDSWEET